jgi:hypothetical protein
VSNGCTNADCTAIVTAVEGLRADLGDVSRDVHQIGGGVVLALGILACFVIAGFIRLGGKQ